MAKKGSSKSQEGYYGHYKTSGKHAKNRKIKLERQLKLQPNNEQVKQALLDIKYRRRTPGNNVWSHSGIALAKVFKAFSGNFNQNILSNNPRVAAEALQSLKSKAVNFKLPKEVVEGISNKAMFSFKARMKTRGEYLHPNAKGLTI